MIPSRKRAVGFLILLVLFCFLVIGRGLALGTVWYVDGEKGSSGDGTSWGQAFKTIQEAIDGSAGGDEIWVKMGTYALSSTVTVNKPVSIYGGFIGQETGRDQRDWLTNITIIDGQETVRGFYVDADARIDGLTITRGHAGYDGNGGGIYIDSCSPTIINSTLLENGRGINSSGGGIYSYFSSPTLENCRFYGNFVDWRGGGIYNQNSNGTINNCVFDSNNTNRIGGAIFNMNSSPTITNSTFHQNGGHMEGAGAIYNGNSSPLIENCIFTENRAFQNAGAIWNQGSSPTITNCIFTENSTAHEYYTYGGAILNGNSSPIISNCVFSKNYQAMYGGAIANLSGSPTIVNSTIYDNSAYAMTSGNWGGGIYNKSSSATITNCIFWRNHVWRQGLKYEQIYDADPSTATVAYSDIQGGYPGVMNIDADPLFADPEDGDLHLTADSPCIDAGTANTPDLPQTDFEGNPRIFGFAPDMGADEFVFWAAIDIQPGTSPNIINLGAKGVVPVAILTTGEFDASTVDPETVVFADASPKHWAMTDLDSDGDLDMILHFKTQELNLNEQSTKATLIGLTYGGMPFQGTDTVNIVNKE